MPRRHRDDQPANPLGAARFDIALDLLELCSDQL